MVIVGILALPSSCRGDGRHGGRGCRDGRDGGGTERPADITGAAGPGGFRLGRHSGCGRRDGHGGRVAIARPRADGTGPRGRRDELVRTVLVGEASHGGT